eukprot:COSAG01_NODE_1072_length_11863_cov_13.614587_9_plen_85_part_00
MSTPAGSSLVLTGAPTHSDPSGVTCGIHPLPSSPNGYQLEWRWLRTVRLVLYSSWWYSYAAQLLLISSGSAAPAHCGSRNQISQ